MILILAGVHVQVHVTRHARVTSIGTGTHAEGSQVLVWPSRIGTFRNGDSGLCLGIRCSGLVAISWPIRMEPDHPAFGGRVIDHLGTLEDTAGLLRIRPVALQSLQIPKQIVQGLLRAGDVGIGCILGECLEILAVDIRVIRIGFKVGYIVITLVDAVRARQFTSQILVALIGLKAQPLIYPVAQIVGVVYPHAMCYQTISFVLAAHDVDISISIRIQAPIGSGKKSSTDPLNSGTMRLQQITLVVKNSVAISACHCSVMVDEAHGGKGLLQVLAGLILLAFISRT